MNRVATADAIPVGVAEYAVSSDERPLKTSGVGSCGVVVVRDEVAAVSGLLHFMLPEAASPVDREAKFADSGIDALFSALESKGGDRSRTWAKLAGGATMIDFQSMGRPIGERNIEAARNVLDALEVPVRAADVGGDAGRRVTFDPASGELLIKTASSEAPRRL
ncbi:chemotaxis protein CheD [Natrarchaeobius sp. A-rgal3]|uniref:chemotaxis protein CheD n=1 Tax=Natrarchaeobius versutus TaxID=1679078 RepID=UPI0035102F60